MRFYTRYLTKVWVERPSAWFGGKAVCTTEAVLQKVFDDTNAADAWAEEEAIERWTKLEEQSLEYRWGQNKDSLGNVMDFPYRVWFTKEVIREYM